MRLARLTVLAIVTLALIAALLAAEAQQPTGTWRIGFTNAAPAGSTTRTAPAGLAPFAYSAGSSLERPTR